MRIAIVEDNAALASAIAYRLGDQGHATDIIGDGRAGDAFLAQDGADLVVLDINLPGMDGLEVLARLRARGDGTPVLLLTARSGARNSVAGLDLGADDYLAKPFEMDELEARIRALLRRRSLQYNAVEAIGELVFDRDARSVSTRGAPLDIPRRELAVFECLLERRGRIVSRTQLLDHVYGVGAAVEDSAVEPHISRLRRRIAAHGVAIKTVRGLGYFVCAAET